MASMFQFDGAALLSSEPEATIDNFASDTTVGANAVALAGSKQATFAARLSEANVIGLPLYLYIAISITGIFSLTPKQLIEILIMAAASETGISHAIKRGKRLVKNNLRSDKAMLTVRVLSLCALFDPLINPPEGTHEDQAHNEFSAVLSLFGRIECGIAFEDELYIKYPKTYDILLDLTPEQFPLLAVVLLEHFLEDPTFGPAINKARITITKHSISCITRMVSALQQQTANSTSAVARISHIMDTLQKTCAKHSERLTNVEHAVEKNTIQIGANTTQIGANTIQIGANTTQIGANTTQIGENTTQIGAHTIQIGANNIDIGNLKYSVKKSDRVLADQSHVLDSLKMNLSRVSEISSMANTTMRSRMDELEKALKQQETEKKNEAKKAYDAAVKAEAQAKANYKAAYGKSP